VHDIIRFMARGPRSGTSADPGHAGAGGVRRGGHTQVASAGRTVFLVGFVCLILAVMVARLLILMAEAHSAFDRAWLPTVAAGCAVAVGWAELYAAAIWRYPGQRWVQWIGYAYAFATVALMAPFFPRIPGVRFSFTSRLHRGSSPPLLDSLTLGAMAFVAAGITIAALAVLLNRPLPLLAAWQLATRGGADASSMLHVRARLREVGRPGPGRGAKANCGSPPARSPGRCPAAGRRLISPALRS
jgi:hypothetical protein